MEWPLNEMEKIGEDEVWGKELQDDYCVIQFGEIPSPTCLLDIQTEI